MKVQHYILATAGHVDHGKSALVKALTGTDPDRLPEEKARGITIDLGFAFLQLAGVGTTFEVGIIDVPGHEDFVKNMVAGMGAIDAALLVVAADDGWMPQTQEHFEILNYLGVKHGAVAITKSDLGGSGAVADDVRRRLRGTALAEAAIVETSAVTGAGLAELRTALAKMLEVTPAPRDIGKPQLSVDRVFSLRGLGTVVTGTLAGGLLTRGQSLVVQPGGKGTRARTVQTHGRDVTHALPGMRTAINLPDVSTAEVRRGDVIVGSNGGRGTQTLVAALWSMSAEIRLREGVRVNVHVGSVAVAGTVQWAKDGANGATRIARLRLESPVYAVLGDRLVVRDWSARETVAGGTVVDLAVGRGWHLRAAGFLCRAMNSEETMAWAETQVQWDLAVPASALLEQSRFSFDEVQAAVERLAQRDAVKRVGTWVVDASWLEGVLHQVVGLVEAHHKARPQDRGIALAALQEQLRRGKRKIDAGLFDLLVAGIGDMGIVTAGVFVKRNDHAPALPAGLQRSGEAIRAALRARPFDPPSKKELVQQAGAGGAEAMAFLVQGGEAVALGDEAVIGAEAFDEGARRIRRELEVRGKATVSELKALLATSRRIAVPLLEAMDARGITARRGDVRVLGRSAAE